MANEKDKAVKINGRKRRSWKQADGTFSDPFAEFDFFSRTFLPPNTDVIEADTDEDMIIELKKAKNNDVKFDLKNLSVYSQIKFLDNKLDDKINTDVKPIEIKPIVK